MSLADCSTSERQKQIYERSFSRIISPQPLQPYLDARPVLTKYSIMPVVDPRKQIQTSLVQHSTFNPQIHFNPGNNGGPWSGFASNINTESELRNQIYGLQKCSQAAYVPDSSSTLYKYEWNASPVQPSQPFPNLFKEERFSSFNPNPNPNMIGYALFNNATRQQVKDLTETK
jgi:hypothetical protein